MRVISVLCLIFGFAFQTFLDGQTFTHAVAGIILGAIAAFCGLKSARQDPPHRSLGRFMAVLGVGLGVWCIITLPSAYRFQKQFNDRREQRQREKQAATPGDNARQSMPDDQRGFNSTSPPSERLRSDR